MKCEVARERIHSFLDGGLAVTEREAFEHHLGTCATCRAEVGRRKRFEARLRAALQERDGTEGLWARIQADLGGRHEDGSSAKRRRPPTWGKQAIAAALLALAVVTGLIGGRVLLGPQDLQARLVQVPVDELRTFIDSGRPLDIASADPELVRRWFVGKLAFAPPPLGRPVVGAELIGGRLCIFLDRRSASYMYRAEGRLVSLYIMPTAGLEVPKGEVVQVAGRSAVVRRVGGFTHVIWTEGGLLYSLVSELAPARLLDRDWGLEV